MKQQLENLFPESNMKLNPKVVFSSLNGYELIENIFLFLLSRIYFMDYLISPFGIPFFSALFFRKKRPYYIISSILGMLSSANSIFLFKYAGSILIVMSVQLIFSKELEHKKNMTALISTASVFLNGFIYVLTEGLFLYDTMLLVLECGLVFLSFFMFDKALITVKALICLRHCRPIEILTLTSLLGVAVFSISITENFWPLAHIGAIFSILLLGQIYGFTVCAPAGAIFGLALCFSTPFPSQMICIYSLSSLFSGFLSRYGKLAASGIFALASFVITFLLCPEANGILTISYVAAACLLLYFVPEKIFAHGEATPYKLRKEYIQSQKVKEFTSSEITKMISSIDSVGTIFYQVIDSFRETKCDTSSALFDVTADSVCNKCSLCKFCWNKDKKKTQAAAEKMYSIMESKSTLSRKDVPKDFSDMCIRCEEFVCELNKNYESMKVAKMWEGKVHESKRLIAEQFKNISMILGNLKASIEEKTSFIPEAERRISSELSRNGISVDEISVHHNGGYSVSLDKMNCDSKTQCNTLIPAVISEILEVSMVSEPVECSSGTCHVKFFEKPKLATDIAISRAIKEHSSGNGDTATFFPIDAGRVAIVLADGMGSGELANFQSSVAVELTKKLLLAGFNKETCIRLINDILMTNADHDTFSTIDLCVVNLYTGKTEFIKAGSVNSYLKLKDSFDTVSASSLPAGIVSSVEPDTDKKILVSGDLLIMATDGVTDVLDTDSGNEIFKMSENFSGTAQELSDIILSRALELSGGLATDDMTVLVCRVMNNI